MTLSDNQIKPGDVHTRAEIRAVLGGSSQGGICPAIVQKNVLLFSDHTVGVKYGYHDGWLTEEDELGPVYEYTGAGANGDQTFGGQFGKGNTAVLRHVEQERTLHLFVAEGKAVGSDAKLHRYVGAFELDVAQPYVVRQSAGLDFRQRRAIVFRLRPLTGYVQRVSKDEVPPAAVTKAIRVPASTTASKLVEPERNRRSSSVRSAVPATVAERREASLSDGLEAYLRARLHEVNRCQITIAGKSSTLLTDLYDTTADVLYEAKGSSGREAVRMALGQLLDYSRFVHAPEPRIPQRAVLLPEPPEQDLQDLLAEHSISIVYPGEQEGTFIGVPGLPLD
ncbi:hypothetical protein ACIRPK_14540 [Kitasatospora sp. NPDC101801]|uniref:hypothetical protein n=1 Tax=Kitasatospora sp. NPDC101801 TaxID=3364103 RepID=UPI003818969A